MSRVKSARGWAALVLGVVTLAVVGVGAASAGIAARPVTAGGLQAQQPAVSGMRVVWADYRDARWDLWLYDGVAHRSRRLTSSRAEEAQPVISGNLVAYVAYSATTGGDIWLYDISTGQTVAVCADAGDQLNPAISGNKVIWEDHSSSYRNSKLFVRDLGAGVTVQLTPTSDDSYRRPRVAGDKLVYERVSADTGRCDVMACDLSVGAASEVAVAATDADERLPVTDGDWVVWVEARPTTGLDVVAKQLSTGKEVVVAGKPGEQTTPVIAGGAVYYVDVADGVSVKAKALDPAATARNLGTITDVSGLTASGTSLAWLRPEGDTWKVRALLSSESSLVQATSAFSSTPAWSAFQFAATRVGGDMQPPTVTTTSVKPGQTGVSETAPLTVRFSESMSASSVNVGTVRLVDQSTGELVDTTVRYSALTRSAVVTPVEPLSGTYSLTVASGVRDLAGNTIVQPRSVVFATAGEALVSAAAPGRVRDVIARISAADGRVKVTWTGTYDPDGDMLGYQVKRSATPSFDPASLSAATTITPISGPMTIPSADTSATFAAAADEVAKTSTYYYTVVAIDAAGNRSAIWYNSAPNPHATDVNGANTNTCRRCHDTHGGASGGMLSARGAESCYNCHGGTGQSISYGSGSINNIQAEYFDYPYTTLDPNPPAAPSRHGNAYIRQGTDNQQCDMCHAPHRSSYSPDKTVSGRKLLKRPQSPTDVNSTPVVYTTDAAPMGNALCFSCHGAGAEETSPAVAPYTTIYSYGGPQAYANTAGGHNDANWNVVGAAGAAHGSQNLTDAARPALPNGGTLPKNDCQVCHAEHGSNSDSLLSLRRTPATADFSKNGAVCLACHATPAEGAVETQAAGTRPYTWNGRSIKTEFSRVGSKHPNNSADGVSADVADVWAQTTAAEFATGELDNVVATASDAVELAPVGTGYAASGQLLSPAMPTVNGITAGWGQLILHGNAPTESTLVFDVVDAVDGTVLIGNLSLAQSPVTLATIDANLHPFIRVVASLTGNAPAPRAAFTDSFDTTIDVGTTWQNTYVNSDDPDLVVNIPVATITFEESLIATESGMTTTSVTSTGTPATPQAWSREASVGAEGSIGYALTGLVNHSNHTMVKKLGDLSSARSLSVSYYWNNTGSMTSGDYLAVDWSSNGGTTWKQVANHTTLNQTAWTLNTITGLAKNAAGSNCQLRFRSDAAAGAGLWGGMYADRWGVDEVSINDVGDPTDLWPLIANNELTLKAEGAGFAGTADQGEILYLKSAARPSWLATASFDVRIKMDAVRGNVPQAGLMIRTGSTEASASAAEARWVSLRMIDGLRVELATRNTYKGTASVVASDVTTPPQWMRLVFDRTANTVTAYTSTDNDVWFPLADPISYTLDSQILPGLCLSSGTNGFFSQADYDSFSLSEVVIGGSTVTPRVDDWSISYTYVPDDVGSKTTCANCHNAHFIAEGSGAWDTRRVSNPLDTNATYVAPDFVDFCLSCHGNTGYNAATGAIKITAVNNSASVLRPYDIELRGSNTWPFFAGWNKDLTNSSYKSSGHYTTAGVKAKCETCHDPHGSNFRGLRAWTRPASGITGGSAGVRSNTDTATINEENLCYQCHGDGSATRGKATGAANIYTPAQSTYKHAIGTAGRHSSKETRAQLLAQRHCECEDCHNPHSAQTGTRTLGKSEAGNMLRGVKGVRPVTWPTTDWPAKSATNHTISGVTWVVEPLDGEATDYEAWLCFKCHSSYLESENYGNLSGGTGPLTTSTNKAGVKYRETDLALEFNPSNESGHNVIGTAAWPKTTVAQGLKYSMGSPDLKLSSAWAGGGTTQVPANYRANKMTCTDCHSYDATGARGPHGSGSKFLVVRPGTTSSTANWYTTTLSGWGSSNFLCRKCHTAKTSNTTHNKSDHNRYSCETCHVRIPHGWKRPRLLRRAAVDPMPYSDSTVRGLAGFTARNYTGDIGERDCGDTCGEHGSVSNPWP